MGWLVGYTTIGVITSLIHLYLVAKEKACLSLKDLLKPENSFVAPLWPIYIAIAIGVGIQMLYEKLKFEIKFDPEQVILWKKKQ